MLPMLAISHAIGNSRKIITVGFSGASYGWNEGSFGSIEPIDGATGIEMPNAAGEYMTAVYTVTTGGADLTTLGDTPGASQSDFTTLYVQDGTGALRAYTSASATFVAANPSWVWGDGTDDVFDNTSNGELRAVFLA